MGFQIYYCKFCRHQFGWCSVGGFSEWGRHDKKCKVLNSKRKLNWVVR